MPLSVWESWTDLDQYKWDRFIAVVHSFPTAYTMSTISLLPHSPQGLTLQQTCNIYYTVIFLRTLADVQKSHSVLRHDAKEKFVEWASLWLAQSTRRSSPSAFLPVSWSVCLSPWSLSVSLSLYFILSLSVFLSLCLHPQLPCSKLPTPLIWPFVWWFI